MPSSRISPATASSPQPASAPRPPRHGLDPEPLLAVSGPARARSRSFSPPRPTPPFPRQSVHQPGRLSSAGQRRSTSGLGRSGHPHPAPPPAPPRSYSSGSRSRTEGRADRRPLSAAVRPAWELDPAPTSSRKVSMARGFGWGGLRGKKKLVARPLLGRAEIRLWLEVPGPAWI